MKVGKILLIGNQTQELNVLKSELKGLGYEVVEEAGTCDIVITTEPCWQNLVKDTLKDFKKPPVILYANNFPVYAEDDIRPDMFIPTILTLESMAEAIDALIAASHPRDGHVFHQSNKRVDAGESNPKIEISLPQVATKTENRYRNLFESMAEGFAHCVLVYHNDIAVDFLYLQVNHRFEELTGLKNVVGKRVSEIIPGLDKSNPEILEIYARVVQTGVAERFETYIANLELWLALSVSRAGSREFIVVFENVNENKRADAALRKSESEARSLLEAMMEMVVLHEVVYDDDGNAIDYRILECNQAFSRITGIPREKAVGGLASEIYGTGRAPYLKLYARVAAGGAPVHFESEFLPLKKYFEISVYSPQKGRFGTTSNDITARVLSQARLRTSEISLANSQRVAHVGSWVWDIKADQLTWSDEMYRVFGLEKNTSTGKLSDVLAQSIHPDDREAVERSNLAVIEEKSPQPLEYRVIWPDNSVHVIWAEAGELIMDDSGRPSMLSGIAQDITERKRAENRLRESEEKFRLAFDHANIGVCMLGMDGIFIQVNQKLSAILGYDRYELEGKHFLEISLPEEADLGLAVMNKIIHGELESAIFEKRYIHKNKNIILAEVATSLVRNASNQPLYFVTQIADITRQRQDEEQLLKYREHLEELILERTGDLVAAREQAEASNRAKGDSLAMMSHEIRTPLNGVLGLAQLLAQTNLDARQRDYLEKMQSSGENLLTTINDILDFSRIDAGKLIIEEVEFSLQEVLNKLGATLHYRAQEKGLDLKILMGENFPARLVGDPARIGQVLLNLVGNAIKFTPKGDVSVSSRVLDQADEQVYLEFRVEDSGIGIEADQLSQLFQPFVQAEAATSRKFGGSGLGLAISQRLVEMMGGKIGVESQPGKGSVFTFTIQVYSPQPGTSPSTAAVSFKAPDHQQGSDKPGLSLHGCSVLLAEDNEINQMVAADLLVFLGAVVTIASNGLEAVDLAGKQRFDVILMDIQMPGLDGYQATKKIRIQQSANNLRVPIIAMTAHAMDGDRQKVLQAGLDDYISKPIGLAGLTEVLSIWYKPALGRVVGEQSAERPAGWYAGNEHPVDAEGALKRLNNNKQLYQRLLTIFGKEHLTAAGKIRAFLDKNDRASARSQAHSLKGAAAAIGADSIFEASRRLETAIESRDKAGELTALDQIDGAAQNVKNFIESYNRVENGV